MADSFDWRAYCNICLSNPKKELNIIFFGFAIKPWKLNLLSDKCNYKPRGTEIIIILHHMTPFKGSSSDLQNQKAGHPK